MSYNQSLASNSNYPPMSQSDWDRAPWNQVENEPIKVNVDVTITLTKTIEVEVDDYTVERETHRGRIVSEDYDFSECDLRKAVDDQLPKPEGWEIDDIYTELN